MPSTPTTKSQVQAYRFVLRRMQSALVRRDSVMLHDPMRSHGRATIVGFLLGLLGMVGFIVFGLISPSPAVPGAPAIVIGQTSGQIYVVSGNPATLTPTFNLASARLLLMSQQQGGGSATVVTPTVVPDSALEGMPRGRRTGIVDGPQLLPTAAQRISDNWAVCDNIVIDTRLPAAIQLQNSHRETTVFAGVSSLGQELAQNQAFLVQSDDNKYYLIYRLPPDPNNPNADNTVRAEVDPTDTAVATAFNLNGPVPRHVSIGLLNAIPPVGPLAVPAIPDKGGTANFAGLRAQGLTNGSVFAVNDAGGQEVYVLLPNGIQQLSLPVANMIFASESGAQTQVPSVPLSATNNVRHLQPGDDGALAVSTMPSVVPTILDTRQYPTACLGWDLVNNQPHTALYVGSALPTPAGKNLIDIGEPGPTGLKIDHFYMPTGQGAVVQSVTGADTIGKGPISLVTDSGTRYGIPDVATATGLGLYDQPPRPAPEAILSLLPTGTSLNVQDAQRSYDDIQVVPGTGSYPSQAAQQSQAPASSSSGG
ncbi:MAG TPA: type VII secretion protein EccB [Amycolatopsis sp.]|nr:type VII secretion protein EccB [Amycolatopsis sp.]